MKQIPHVSCMLLGMGTSTGVSGSCRVGTRGRSGGKSLLPSSKRASISSDGSARGRSGGSSLLPSSLGSQSWFNRWLRGLVLGTSRTRPMPLNRSSISLVAIRVLKYQ